jgi:hypothetical protein
MKLGKREILVILTLILILLVLGFFLYVRFGEGFNGTTIANTNPAATVANTNPVACPTVAPAIYTSITSLVAEYTIDIEPANDPEGRYYLIFYGQNDNQAAGILAVDEKNNNSLTTQILNDDRDLNSKWYINTVFPDNKTRCVISTTKCTTMDDCKNYPCLTLTTIFDRDNILIMRQFDNQDNQKWVQSTTKKANLDRGIIISRPVLGMAAQIAESANQPTSDIISDLNLNDENSRKLQNVLDLISSNLKSYSDVASSDSGASYGVSSGAPIKVNLSLSGNALGLTVPTGGESFTDTTQDVRKLLNDYENKMGPGVNTKDSVYTLDTALGSVISCPKIDENDYAISRVGQCNCDLSGL